MENIKDKISFWLNVLLIIILIALFIYMWRNVELIKMIGQNSCKLCEARTGAKCFYAP